MPSRPRLQRRFAHGCDCRGAATFPWRPADFTRARFSRAMDKRRGGTDRKAEAESSALPCKLSPLIFGTCSSPESHRKSPGCGLLALSGMRHGGRGGGHRVLALACFSGRRTGMTRRGAEPTGRCASAWACRSMRLLPLADTRDERAGAGGCKALIFLKMGDLRACPGEGSRASGAPALPSLQGWQELRAGSRGGPPSGRARDEPIQI